MAKKRISTKRRMNPVLEAMGRVHDENILIRSANKANLILTLMVIHDKFDFDREQCERFLEEYNKQLEAYNEGYVERVSDFEEVLKDELGIEIRL